MKIENLLERKLTVSLPKIPEIAEKYRREIIHTSVKADVEANTYYKPWHRLRVAISEARELNNWKFPTYKDLKKLPQGDYLISAIKNYHGGINAVRKKYNEESRMYSKKIREILKQNIGRSPKDWTNLQERMRKAIAENNKKLPSYTDLIKIDSDLANAAVVAAIVYHGGINNTRRKLA